MSGVWRWHVPQNSQVSGPVKSTKIQIITHTLTALWSKQITCWRVLSWVSIREFTIWLPCDHMVLHGQKLIAYAIPLIIFSKYIGIDKSCFSSFSQFHFNEYIIILIIIIITLFKCRYSHHSQSQSYISESKDPSFNLLISVTRPLLISVSASINRSFSSSRDKIKLAVKQDVYRHWEKDNVFSANTEVETRTVCTLVNLSCVSSVPEIWESLNEYLWNWRELEDICTLVSQWQTERPFSRPPSESPRKCKDRKRQPPEDILYLCHLNKPESIHC